MNLINTAANNNTDFTKYLEYALLWVIYLTEFPEQEIFKISIEWWDFTTNLVDENIFTPFLTQQSSAMFNFQNQKIDLNTIKFQLPLVQQTYIEAISKVRPVIVDRMVRPDEVQLEVDDNGNLIWFEHRNTEKQDIYAVMQKILKCLTKMGCAEVNDLLVTMLKSQSSKEGWDPQKLNAICWSVGSITGSMNEESERSFLITVIKDLLNLCERKSGKDNKAIVASNIM